MSTRVRGEPAHYLAVRTMSSTRGLRFAMSGFATLESAVGASGPTTGAALSVLKAWTAPLDPAASRFCFLGRLNPTDPLVACERCNILPCR